MRSVTQAHLRMQLSNSIHCFWKTVHEEIKLLHLFWICGWTIYSLLCFYSTHTPSPPPPKILYSNVSAIMVVLESYSLLSTLVAFCTQLKGQKVCSWGFLQERWITDFEVCILNHFPLLSQLSDLMAGQTHICGNSVSSVVAALLPSSWKSDLKLSHCSPVTCC